MPTFNPQVTRRSVLGLTVTAAAAGFTGCSSSTSPSSPNSSAAGGATIPSVVQPAALPGAKVSSIPNVPVVQTQYPTQPAATVSTPPGNGDTITTLQITYTPPAPPASQNKWLAQYEHNLNAKIKPTLMNDANIAEKTQAVIAGGDLPDIFYLNLPKVPAAQTAVLQGAFLDLSAYIGGDKVKDYPNLGGIQEVSWQNNMINGKVYGVPYPTTLIANGLPQYRLDWQQKLEISDPKNADDMFDMFVALTTKDPNGNGKNDTWVWGAMTEWDNQTAINMFGVPNNWRKNDDGTFTKHIESDEYKAAIEWLVKCREAGIFHPNAASNGYAQSQELFNNGQLAVFGGSLMGVTWPAPVKGVTDWNSQIWSLFPVGHDGGPVKLWQSSATFGFFAIPAKLQSNEAKVHELLGVLNYWSAPFGTAEYTFMNFGIEGHNFERKKGAPVLSTDSAMQGELAASYVPTPAQQNIFVPGENDLAIKIQQGFEKVTPDSIADPSLGLVSQAQISTGAQLQQLEKDMYTDLVSGRESIDALPSMIDKWRKAGGDQVRSELEAAAK